MKLMAGKNKFLFWVTALTLTEFLFAVSVMGIYFGWLDDTLVLLRAKGDVVVPATGFNNMRGYNFISYGIYWLYNHVPGINWTGFFLMAAAGLSLFNINYLILRLLNRNGRGSTQLIVWISLAFFLAFLIENIYLINYSRISILLSFSSLLCALAYIGNDRPGRSGLAGLVFWILCFLIGWNIRFPLLMVTLPFMLLLPLVMSGWKRGMVVSMALLLLTGLNTAVSFLIIGPADREEFHNLNDTEQYLNNILNGFNSKMPDEFNNPRDSVKAMALYYWYFADVDTMLDLTYLRDMGGNNPLRRSVLANWKSNLRQEWAKATSQYLEPELASLNWAWKNIAIAGFALLLPLLYNPADRRRILRCWAVVLVSLMLMLTIAVFLKMEDRLLNPFLIITMLTVWIIASMVPGSRMRKWSLLMLALVFTTIGTIRTPGYLKVADFRKEGLDTKTAIRTELRESYQDRTVFMDGFTSLILETSPFCDEDFPDNWLSILEMQNLFNPRHAERLTATTGCIDWPCFFDAVAAAPDKYVFYFAEDRMKLTAAYLQIIYGRDYTFTPDSMLQSTDRLRGVFPGLPLQGKCYLLSTTISPDD